MDGIDRHGDVFRYPFNYSLIYRFRERQIDVDNIFDFMAGIFNILDGCGGMLSMIADYEMETLAEMYSCG